MQDTNGKFYGNSSGNSNGGAEFYSLDMGIQGLSPDWSHGREKLARPLEFLARDSLGTTSVKFNGTSATFTVSSDTFLTATVPTGATTGFVNVVTPGGDAQEQPQISRDSVHPQLQSY